jgi:hypothetical protein
MYKNMAPLRHKAHAELRLVPKTDHRFAQDLLLAPIVVDELAEAAREYAIVFPKGAALPAVLLGVRQGVNAYVGKKGEWLARYVPAHVRHYPFMLTRTQPTDDGLERLAVMMDLDSPLLSHSEGEPLFDAGKPAAAVQASIDLLRAMRARLPATQAIVAAMDKAGILVERQLRVQGQGRAEARATGIRTVDEKAFNALPTAAFNALRKAGALPLIYAHLLSLGNLRHGPISRS